MWQPLSSLFDLIGRLRFSVPPLRRRKLSVGRPGAVDAQGGFDWQTYRSARSLYAVWGPPSDSPWIPYHCVPLFASLDTLRQDLVWPTAPEDAQLLEVSPHLDQAAAGVCLGSAWVQERVWLILDLPGIQSVPLAVRFLLAGFQPICTFDHWPHPAGLLNPTHILAQLLRFAPHVASARSLLSANSPPLWICDRERLGTRVGRPMEFDNRYYLDDSLLPGPNSLKKAGINHILCMVPDAEQRPLDDIWAYFQELRNEGFHNIHGVSLQDPKLEPFEFSQTSVRSRFSTLKYQRSAAGGFGRLVPSESSSSG